jgi:hypothetical protein
VALVPGPPVAIVTLVGELLEAIDTAKGEEEPC